MECDYFRIEQLKQRGTTIELAGGLPHYTLLISTKGHGRIAGCAFERAQVWLVPAHADPVVIASDDAEWLMAYFGNAAAPFGKNLLAPAWNNVQVNFCYAVVRPVGHHIRMVPPGALLLSWCLPDAAAVTSVRDADAVCADCHQKIYTTYLGTRMANASGLAANGIEPGVSPMRHLASNTAFRWKDGQAWLTYSARAIPRSTVKQRLSYFLGSGNHGRTYLYSVEGYWFETPIAYYARKRGYDMRPAYLKTKKCRLTCR